MPRYSVQNINDVQMKDLYAFKIFTNIDSALVDPKKFSKNSFVTRKTDVCIIPPNSFALARTVEYFKIPRDDFCSINM